MASKKDRWYRHPKHGHMLRRPCGNGYDMVVTSLVAEAMEYELSESLWSAYKHRLAVNAGCGGIAVESHREHDRNPEFLPCRSVPKWIRRDFTGILEA